MNLAKPDSKYKDRVVQSMRKPRPRSRESEELVADLTRIIRSLEIGTIDVDQAVDGPMGLGHFNVRITRRYGLP